MIIKANNFSTYRSDLECTHPNRFHTLLVIINSNFKSKPSALSPSASASQHSSLFMHLQTTLPSIFRRQCRRKRVDKQAYWRSGAFVAGACHVFVVRRQSFRAGEHRTVATCKTQFSAHHSCMSCRRTSGARMRSTSAQQNLMTQLTVVSSRHAVRKQILKDANCALGAYCS